MQKFGSKSERGFTLMEIMVVLVIAGILLMIGYKSWSNGQINTKIASFNAKVKLINDKMSLAADRNGSVNGLNQDDLSLEADDLLSPFNTAITVTSTAYQYQIKTTGFSKAVCDQVRKSYSDDVLSSQAVCAAGNANAITLTFKMAN
jgi:prepilin-type N-terminal cleavage/methylation domain-containing protein